MKKIIISVMALVVLIVGIVLLVNGLNYDIPRRTFSFSSIEEYVGGDAYNAMIEASIRGGEIAAAEMSKTVFICSGVLTISMGLLIETVAIIIKRENKKGSKKTEDKTEEN